MEWPAKRFEKPSAAVFGTKEVSSITTPISSCRGQILAGAVSTNDGITLHKLRFEPRFAIRLDYASGDSAQTGKDLHTFNPLFPNPMYSSLSALLGPSNLTDVGPTFVE